MKKLHLLSSVKENYKFLAIFLTLNLLISSVAFAAERSAAASAKSDSESAKQQEAPYSGTKWEYKVKHFDRDDFSAFGMSRDAGIKVQEIILNQLGSQGWEYAGTLCNDGINGRFILFKRKKLK